MINYFYTSKLFLIRIVFIDFIIYFKVITIYEIQIISGANCAKEPMENETVKHLSSYPKLTSIENKTVKYEIQIMSNINCAKEPIENKTVKYLSSYPKLTSIR